MTSVQLIYFSPTGTTRKVLEAVARGLAADQLERLDLASQEATAAGIREVSNGLAVIGTPVYSGRVPLQAVEALQLVRTRNTPAVVVAVYGNRAYDDALLELTDMARKCGFSPVAAAVFIGEHSFSTRAAPIAEGRPDWEDLEKAESFGKIVKERIAIGLPTENVILQVPGNFPYRERNPSPPPPATDEVRCIKCSKCATTCPTKAITVKDEAVVTEKAKCIACCACVKNCPSGARHVNPRLAQRAEALSASCRERKEPQFFIS